ncbi:DinB family protein [Flavobacterium sp. 3HN19-14]|uniref:DinB family protein n=1 Tax=Flavobacterium sp. 3HN19-14 TaxID=3448133 RepID=UPI003EE2AB49
MKNQNAVEALLDEYQKVIADLQRVISIISNEDLKRIVDAETQNSDCKSIQTVLAHVVNACFAYCIYIRKLRNMDLERPAKTLRNTISEYIDDLNKMMVFTVATFENITDNELEEYRNSHKMKTS